MPSTRPSQPASDGTAGTAGTVPGHPAVHLFYGLSGSGKTTLARTLERELPAVRFTLDEWILRLHPGLHHDAPGYPELAGRTKELIWSVAEQVLSTGTDVLLDWNSWSRERRGWAVERAAAHPATPRVILHRLATTPEVAGVRLAARAGDGGRAGRHTHRLDATDNAHLATIMEAPEAAEGLTVVTVGDAG